ncbi:hypothetical protein GCM10010530_11820 [Kribbella aluminosa]
MSPPPLQQLKAMAPNIPSDPQSRDLKLAELFANPIRGTVRRARRPAAPFITAAPGRPPQTVDLLPHGRPPGSHHAAASQQLAGSRQLNAPALAGRWEGARSNRGKAAQRAKRVRGTRSGGGRDRTEVAGGVGRFALHWPSSRGDQSPRPGGSLEGEFGLGWGVGGVYAVEEAADGFAVVDSFDGFGEEAGY